MKQFSVNDPEITYNFFDQDHWELNFRPMRCSEHKSGAGLNVNGTPNDTGGVNIAVVLDVCCETFFNQIIEKEKQIIEGRKNREALSNFHEQRAANSEISETILVDGEEILEVEIKDLWHSSADGYYLELTGNRTKPVPSDEAQRIRDFLEHRNDVLGIHKKLNINGQNVYDNEILEVIYKGETPFVKLTDNRLIEIKPVEVYAIQYFVDRNKKLKGE